MFLAVKLEDEEEVDGYSERLNKRDLPSLHVAPPIMSMVF